MDRKERWAWDTIRSTVAAGHYRVLRHFAQRMDQRGLFWADVQGVIDAPNRVRSGGNDRFGREKWLLQGKTTDALSIELVCALDVDENGDLTVFITIY
jgi:hypothetical protein